MPRKPKDRAEAARDIESLYGWSRSDNGPANLATDEEVIEVAWDQIQFEHKHGLDASKKYVHKTLY